jgi:D-3-phosphoglycerate dehydrogenase
MHVNGYDIEMAPATNMLFFEYEDRPGVIGKVGTILGQHEINIATMDVGRASRGGTALMGLTLTPRGPDTIDDITSATAARAVHRLPIDLAGLRDRSFVLASRCDVCHKRFLRRESAGKLARL